MTDSVTTLQVQINVGGVGCSGPSLVPMFAINNGSGTYSLGSIPFVNDLPVTASNPLPVETFPVGLTKFPLDNATITTAGTAVMALSAGHALAGCLLQTSNDAGFYVNELGAAGTTVANGTTYVYPFQAYESVPGSGAISVNATVNGVVISGFGLAR